MVTKIPPTLDEMRRRREHIPASEIVFFNLLDALPDEWYVWHSIQWYNDTELRSGEADFLLFHPDRGFLVCEVKGGINYIENGVFYSENTLTGEITKLNKTPFEQAKNSMWNIVEFYENRAKLDPNPEELLKRDYREMWHFPLSFCYFVFFPNTDFKNHPRSIQYDPDRIFDISDINDQEGWLQSDEKTVSPLENFLVRLLDKFRSRRKQKPRTEPFFLEMVGSDMSRILNMKQYYSIRDEELERVNQIQDYLLDALEEKNHCIFKGSAGSGKTFIAMKKAFRNYQKSIRTLLLCYNRELRDTIKKILSEKIGKSYKDIKGKIDVYSINQYLYSILKEVQNEKLRKEMLEHFTNFDYEPLVKELQAQSELVLPDNRYEALLIDEAQDIEVPLWEILSLFLEDKKESQYYVFFDSAQALFVEGFSVNQFGMDPQNDLIILQQNLRNTIEIANWLRNKTSYGEYKEYSGINGFKITSRSFDTFDEALCISARIIKNRFYNHGVDSSKITLLGYYRLENSIEGCDENIDGCYYEIHDEMILDNSFYVIEPKNIRKLRKMLENQNIKQDSYILYKTITSFKGLESDIVILLIKDLEEFKKEYPERYENYLMQVYVGASRAKFKLFFFEFRERTKNQNQVQKRI